MGVKDLINMIKEYDPSVRSTAEIFLYQGFWAIVLHKLANPIYQANFFFIARLISQINRFFTHIEIHPGAKLPWDVFIDHGAGVVIGETAEVGNHVVIFHGVTLGGTGKNSGKRHPTVGNNVMLGAGASILGPLRIGDGAKIGAGAIVVKDVLPNTTIVGEAGRDIHQECSLRKDIDLLKKRLTELENQLKSSK